ncbi:hypothetical protein RhiirA5_347456 [Rhizophagus irregularis]|uniref:Uncharacterized protein n=1 Tax=Rhizophagus irregularis TaxID=588596 RepID=A0A2N0QBY4_9GLOM|nr:hypothetical protein RhiirA5_347456 [Rhizophagus irregularis]
MAKEDIFDKQSQIDALNVLEATRNQKTEEYVDRVNSRLSKRTKMAKGEMDMSLGHKRSYDENYHQLHQKRGYVQLSSVAEVSDTFGKIKFQHIMINLSLFGMIETLRRTYIIDLGDEETLNQVHELLSDYELNPLFERLRLTDEDEYVSAEAHKYMSLFDEIIEERVVTMVI